MFHVGPILKKSKSESNEKVSYNILWELIQNAQSFYI